MVKMISHNLFSTIISVSIYYLMIPLTLSSQSSTALQAAQGTSDLLDLIKTEFRKQNHRIALLETQNRNQDEDIGLLRFYIEFHEELLAARQHCSIRFWLNIGDRKWDRIRGHGSALFVEIFQFFSIL